MAKHVLTKGRGKVRENVGGVQGELLGQLENYSPEREAKDCIIAEPLGCCKEQASKMVQGRAEPEEVICRISKEIVCF